MGTLKWLTVVRLEDKLLSSEPVQTSGESACRKGLLDSRGACLLSQPLGLGRGRGTLITGFELAWST